MNSVLCVNIMDSELVISAQTTDQTFALFVFNEHLDIDIVCLGTSDRSLDRSLDGLVKHLF